MSEKAVITETEVKYLRAEIQTIVNALQRVNGSRELSLSITKLQEGKMWLGMQLGVMNGQDLNKERDQKEMEAVGVDTESIGR